MDDNRTLDGALWALLGAVGGYALRWWQGRKARRELALLRLLRKADSDQQSADMEARLNGLLQDEVP